MEKKLRGYIVGEVVTKLSQWVEFHSETDPGTNKASRFARVVGRLGIKRLGMLDFLVNHNGYRVMFDIR